ncbi:MAG: DUF1080 domain-containing protein [Kiritimatiellae bacterium]|nr:DUF1080 domain-containing protein [Kiritimatiellia bacterium]
MKTFVMCFVMLVSAFASAEMKEPAFQTEETELLAVVTGSTNLNDRVTACQELGHRGTDVSVPVLAALLTDQTDAPLFHAARYGLQNIPGDAAAAALRAAADRLAAGRKIAVQTTLRLRANPVPEGYCGKPAARGARSPLQRGDPAVVPGLIAAALQNGEEARLAVRSLVGFPGTALDDQLIAMLAETPERAHLAASVLGGRRVRKALPALVHLVKESKNAVLRRDACRALASLCKAQEDLPLLLGLLRDNPADGELSGALIRVLGQAFTVPRSRIEIRDAQYGNVAAKRVLDVTDRVRAMVDLGASSILVNNRLAGAGGFDRDIAPGIPKELCLRYSIDGQPDQTLIVRELREATLVEPRLLEEVAVPFFEAYAASSGELRKALRHILAQLERRGRVEDVKGVSYRSIFNGKDLSGWSQQDGFWSVKDGIVTGESTAGHPCKPNHHLVYTAEELTDFELLAEFRLSPGANSGIQLRCKKQFVGDNGYQADMNGGGNYVGFLYHPRQHLVGERGADVTLAADGSKTVERFADGKGLQKLFRVKEWNQIRVKVEGRSVNVWINGVRTTSVTDAREAFLPDKGHIALQLHQGPPMTVEFRNLRLRD